MYYRLARILGFIWGGGSESIPTILLTSEPPNVGRGHGVIHRYLFSVASINWSFTEMLTYSRGKLIG